jgi:hypothetical protein
MASYLDGQPIYTIRMKHCWCGEKIDAGNKSYAATWHILDWKGMLTRVMFPKCANCDGEVRKFLRSRHK